MSDVDGDASSIFDAMTRATIVRKIDRLETDELLELLGHLIVRERRRRLPDQ